MIDAVPGTKYGPWYVPVLADEVVVKARNKRTPGPQKYLSSISCAIKTGEISESVELSEVNVIKSSFPFKASKERKL